jgi:hypothetical protein
MKTVAGPIRRPLRRALFTLLFCIAPLWAMPGIARAQIYVVKIAGIPSTVGKYDATTGAAINANLITELGGGSSNPLAVEPDSPDRLLPSTLPFVNAAEVQGFARMPRALSDRTTLALILSFNPQ